MCAIDECNKPVEARGWCWTHYRRFLRYGDPVGISAKSQCEILGCSRTKHVKGMCKTHHKHFVKYGDALGGKFNAPPGSNYKTKAGYVRVYLPSHPNASYGSVFQHTLVMSDILGRPLRKGESVHHKNGIRDDNRPENLELWTSKKQQPKGQRAADMVIWARSILRDYGNEFPEGVVE